MDGSHFKFHAGAKAEPVLVAWGITTTGKPVLLHLAPGATESTDAWAGFLDDMLGRGLRPPLLVISDRAPGLMAAVEMKLSQSLWQSCVIHRARNLLAKVPKHAQGDVKADYWAIFDGIDAAPGTAAQAEARRRAKRFSAKWRKLFPAAVECLEDDFDHLITLPAVPHGAPQAHPALELHRAHLRRDTPARQGHRPAARRAELPVTRVGRARPRLGGLARRRDDAVSGPAAAGPAARTD